MHRDGQGPTVQEIAQLTARLRRLIELGAPDNPADRDAFLVAKRDLLARIEAHR